MEIAWGYLNDIKSLNACRKQSFNFIEPERLQDALGTGMSQQAQSDRAQDWEACIERVAEKVKFDIKEACAAF